MRDLKQIHYFEKLLDNANNELVNKAKDEGKYAFGYTCDFIPEALLDVDKAFGVRLRAPHTGSTEIATYYTTSLFCSYCKSILERAIEGGYNFLDGMFAVETCSQMYRGMEHFEILSLVNKEKFIFSMLGFPKVYRANLVDSVVTQIREKYLEPMKSNFDIDISSEAIIEAVNLSNEVNGILREISEFRQDERPRVTGTEFSILFLVSRVCPKYLIVDKLRETLEEIKEREPDPLGTYRTRVVVAGSEIDDPNFIRLIESEGALVVADRYCYGAYPGIEHIELKTDNPLRELVELKFKMTQCPRQIDKGRERIDYISNLVSDFKADGVIYEIMKFCDYWTYDQNLHMKALEEEFDVPSVFIEVEYSNLASGQVRTRVGAFIESIEIRQIDKQNKVGY